MTPTWFLEPLMWFGIVVGLLKLTNYHNTNAKIDRSAFFWGRPLRYPQVLRCPLNATGHLVQAATLLKITNWLIYLCSWCRPRINLYFETLWVQWGFILGNFTLKMAELCYNLPLCGYPPPSTLHPYISACGIDKNNLKWPEIQLAVYYRVSSLIAIK